MKFDMLCCNILVGQQVDDFVKAVNIMLNNGWELRGQLTVGYGNFIVQAFVKNEDANGNQKSGN